MCPSSHGHEGVSGITPALLTQLPSLWWLYCVHAGGDRRQKLRRATISVRWWWQGTLQITLPVHKEPRGSQSAIQKSSTTWSEQCVRALIQANYRNRRTKFKTSVTDQITRYDLETWPTEHGLKVQFAMYCITLAIFPWGNSWPHAGWHPRFMKAARSCHGVFNLQHCTPARQEGNFHSSGLTQIKHATCWCALGENTISCCFCPQTQTSNANSKLKPKKTLPIHRE